MFCSKCGNEINDEAVICPNCGCPTSNYSDMKYEAQQQIQNPTQIIKPTNHEGNNLSLSKTLGIIGIIAGIIIPIAGWICGIIGLLKANAVLNASPYDMEATKCKNLNIGALAVSSVAFVINLMFIFSL